MKTALRFETHDLFASGMESSKNPFPPLKAPEVLQMWPIQVDESVAAQDAENINYGCDTGCLPYRIQDRYDRDRKLRPFKVAILENAILKATFLMEFGGRLWSLYHKPTRKELLYKNPVFQPANLALRNAWFSGGVEWNMGMPAHHPFTCAPPFFATLKDSSCMPVLRMYEYERIRSAPYQVDFYLPENSPVLLVRCRLFNPNDYTIPAYWWSNIAVKEEQGLRVLTPAQGAFFFDHESGHSSVKHIPLPVYQDTDITYPANSIAAHDYFFRLHDNNRPWVAALNQNGCGLVQCSTSLLKGRKLFVWGIGPGGRKWQEFLSEPDNPYIEIQAGLGRTQAECLPMLAGEQWDWLEAYGHLEAQPDIVHGSDWEKAYSCVQNELDNLVTQNWLEEELKRSQEMAEATPDKIVQQGSGWGALEEKRRKNSNLKPFNEAIVFEQTSINEDQKPWLCLLEKGFLPPGDTDQLPGSFMVQKEWRVLLEKSMLHPLGNHWFSWMHMGIMHYANMEYEKAESAWRKSLEKEKNPFSYRNLGIYYLDKGEKEQAIEMFKEAWQLNSNSGQLALEYGNALLASGQIKELKDLLNGLNNKISRMARIQLLSAQVALHEDDLEKTEAFFDQIEIADFREGETILMDLWYCLQEKRSAQEQGRCVDKELKDHVRKEHALPARIDFRMSY